VIVEQAENVVERRTKFGRHDSAFWALFSILAVWQNERFCDGQALTRKPDDLVVQL
jgi:hypothetical protein